MTMFFLSCIFLFLCFSVLSTTQVEQDFVKISLYYESFCPYSRQFVVDELFPAYKALNNRAFIVDLVPYGKANQTRIDGNWKFHCQHGPKECLANKIQACVLAKPFCRNDKIGFVYCMMNSSNPASLTNAKTCALKNNLSWSPINSCIQGTEGDNLLADYGERTQALSPKLHYVPCIFCNGIFNLTIENEARENFLKTVCSLFIVKPSVCKAET